jgi:hypothetical protein
MRELLESYLYNVLGKSKPSVKFINELGTHVKFTYNYEYNESGADLMDKVNVIDLLVHVFSLQNKN